MHLATYLFRTSLALLILQVAVPGLRGRAAEAAEPNLDRPNVVLMMADDMGLGDTSAYQDFTGNRDSEQIRTPNMERLARRGVRFIDAHTPSSRCSPTRYSLLTGRYAWRNRLKWWVLFGVQGDPMIERDRPTLGTLFQEHGYRTGLVGKWHVGLRYRKSDGRPAAAWEDADLTQPLFDTPLDHGFDFCRFTSRSHGTSGPAVDGNKSNGPKQNRGPGHIDGRTVIAATGNGKALATGTKDSYVLHELGGRHLSDAMEFLDHHLQSNDTADQPFFLYYPSNSNHGPYTPDDEIKGEPVTGAARNVAGEPMDVRSDYIYENDVVLGHLLDYLIENEDPRHNGQKLIENTIVIFTSDNGAEKDHPTATGPFRSNKGSVFEGGHRVPFMVSWPAGGVGDGDEASEGETNASLLGLQDMFATFAEVLGSEMGDKQKGGEDSQSTLAAWRGETLAPRPMFFNDHKEAEDSAVVALRLDDPVIEGQKHAGAWKLFFDAALLRKAVANPTALYELRSDPKESTDLLQRSDVSAVVKHLSNVALNHRTVGGHRLTEIQADERYRLRWIEPEGAGDATTLDLRSDCEQADSAIVSASLGSGQGEAVKVTIRGIDDAGQTVAGFDVNPRGVGLKGGQFLQVDNGEAFEVRFDRDVIVESVSVVAGNGTCGGYYQIDEQAPLAIYCIDADIDSRDQSGILSDIGFVEKGQTLTLDSSPHFGVESAGQWRLAELVFRVVGAED